MRTRILEAGDAAATADNIRASAALFRASFLSDLVIRSGYLPKVLGVALIVGCFGYLAGVVIDFLALDAGAGLLMVFAAVGGLPELAFVGWLLVRGLRAPGGGAPVPAVPTGSSRGSSG